MGNKKQNKTKTKTEKTKEKKDALVVYRIPFMYGMKVLIYANLRCVVVQMFSQISCIPDLLQKI